MLVSYYSLLATYLFAVIGAHAASGTNPTNFNSTNAFSSSFIANSAGGNAICLEGTISVTTSAVNTLILYSGPPNNMAATEFLLELGQVNSSVVATTNGGPSTVSGTYSIFSKLCIPANATLAANVETVQFLTHGGTLDHTYWDLAPGYSYVDAAALAGYATFSYDRLGIGLSDHPDPIQVVQLPMHVHIAHTLRELLGTPQTIGFIFKNFVGVGHSLGSSIMQEITSQYPGDFGAVILTGISTNLTSIGIGVASTAMQIANTEPSQAYSNLPNGYLISAPVPQAIQYAYYRYPYFVQSIFQSQFTNRMTNALGELLTLASGNVPSSNFSGPVDVVNGQYDLLYCGGDCAFPTDQSALVQPAFYPNAGGISQQFLVPNCGHVINAHLTAPQAFAQMLAFLQVNGIN